MPLECDGKEILEFKGIYLQKAFASKIKRQIPYTKVTKFLPLNSRGNLCNSEPKNAQDIPPFLQAALK